MDFRKCQTSTACLVELEELPGGLGLMFPNRQYRIDSDVVTKFLLTGECLHNSVLKTVTNSNAGIWRDSQRSTVFYRMPTLLYRTRSGLYVR